MTIKTKILNPIARTPGHSLSFADTGIPGKFVDVTFHRADRLPVFTVSVDEPSLRVVADALNTCRDKFSLRLSTGQHQNVITGSTIGFAITDYQGGFAVQVDYIRVTHGSVTRRVSEFDYDEFMSALNMALSDVN